MMQVEKDTIDIGTVNESSEDTIPVKFKLMNIGDAPLRVSSVRTNCGCVIAGYDTITPPESTCIISSSFLPTNLTSGPFEKTLLVTSNARNEARLKLFITGVMQAHIDVSETIVNLPISDSVPAPLFLESRKSDLAVEKVGFLPVDAMDGDPLPLRYEFHALDSTRQDNYNIFRLDVYNNRGLTGPMFGVFVLETNHSEKEQIKLRGSINRE